MDVTDDVVYEFDAATEDPCCRAQYGAVGHLPPQVHVPHQDYVPRQEDASEGAENEVHLPPQGAEHEMHVPREEPSVLGAEYLPPQEYPIELAAGGKEVDLPPLGAQQEMYQMYLPPPTHQVVGWCMTRRRSRQAYLLTVWDCGAPGWCAKPVVTQQGLRCEVCLSCILYRVWLACAATIVPELCSVKIGRDHRPYVEVICHHPVRRADVSDILFGARDSPKYTQTLRRVMSNGLHLVARSL
eukprot:TRINITY_DN453_c0_g1_i1.p1 TRINITY_DN453_c0_g1~~TRINITY_DN453_c0_g1_i1.p1  ORF type:complete len:242 (+),score=62.60 TRINITY_DN453_c0_g1_i1:64-789(+)